MSFSNQFLDELKLRLNLAEIIESKIKVTKRVNNEVFALCPFHKEKTASFSFNVDKGVYNCFGCGERGNIFDFLMKIENLRFVDVIEQLSEKAGLKVPFKSSYNTEIEKKKEKMFFIMKKASEFYHRELINNNREKAFDYLRKRGLGLETIKTFYIGYSSGSIKNFLNYFSELNISTDQLVQSGLLAESTKKKEIFERFNRRIIFPIIDLRGRVIAFGARAIEEGAKVKYINSPETLLFKKSFVVYNLFSARKNIKERNQEIVVTEGYMDVIKLHHLGFKNSVATLGTAFTESHLYQLWKFCNNPVFCFDSDTAGIKAMFRIIDISLPLINHERSVKFALLPNGQDPDDFISKSGLSAMQDLINNSRNLHEMLWESFAHNANLSTPEKKAQFEKNLNKKLSTIKDKQVKKHYENFFYLKIRDLFNNTLQKEGLGNVNYNYIKKKQGPTIYTKNSYKAKKSLPVSTTREYTLVSFLINYPFLLKDSYEEILDLKFHDKNLNEIFLELVDIYNKKLDLDKSQIITYLNNKGKSISVGKLEAFYNKGKDLYIAPTGNNDKKEISNNFYGVLSMHKLIQVQSDMKEAEKNLAENMSKDNLDRLKELKKKLKEWKINRQDKNF